MRRRQFLQIAAVGLGQAVVPDVRAQTQTRSRSDWPDTLGHGFGLALHDFASATLDVVAGAGFTLIRTDFFWPAVEPRKGHYDWSLYDDAALALRTRNLRPVFILGYNNPDAYSGQWMDGITLPDEIAAFANFAAASAQRYRDLQPIWEIYNEPNRSNFWNPTPDPAAYMTLAQATIAALRRADPDCVIIAPALGHKMSAPVLEVDFLEACLKLDLQPVVDGISIHPYVDPEVVEDSYDAVRALLDRYPVQSRKLPILATEWGFAVDRHISEDVQADLLERMFLVNLSLGIPMTIAYSAVDASADYVPDSERHFGIVRADHSPKPAFFALQHMNQSLRGLSFQKRLASRASDFLLVFGDDGKSVIVGWTTGKPRDVSIQNRTILLTGRPIYLDM